MSHLHYAARRGLLDEVRASIQEGQPVDDPLPRTGETALHLAAEMNFAPIVELLLAQGANPHARDKDGWTPLHDAAFQGNDQIVRRLLDAGAEVDARDNRNQSPAALAAMAGHPVTARLLIEVGASPEAAADKRTVLEWIEIGGVPGLFSEHMVNAEEVDEKGVLFVRETMMDKASSVEEYAARHAHETFCFSLHTKKFPDPEVQAWVERYAEILASPELLAECEERFLSETELEAARIRRERHARRAARDKARAER